MTSIEEQLRVAFLAEAQEALDDFSLRLEALSAGEGDDATLEAAFRIAHNIKGAARAVGANGVERVMHGIEDILSNHRANKTLPGRALASAIAGAASRVEQMVLSGNEDATADILRQLATPEPTAEPESPQTGAATGGKTSAATTIRVETQRLDKLLAFVGELLQSESRLKERQQSLLASVQALQERERRADRRDRLQPKTLEQLSTQIEAQGLDLQRYGNLVADVGDAIKRVRMLRLDSLTGFLRNVVRDAAQSLAKNVELKVEFGDAEVDKAVIEQIRDPLMHLLRNAVDHGIESEDERRRQGKAPTATIAVVAKIVGSFAEISVSDDGRGVDLQRVAERARASGLLNQTEATSKGDDELLSLIFCRVFRRKRRPAISAGAAWG